MRGDSGRRDEGREDLNRGRVECRVAQLTTAHLRCNKIKEDAVGVLRCCCAACAGGVTRGARVQEGGVMTCADAAG